MLGEPIPWDNVTFYEMENTRAIRTDRWKYVARHPDGPFELYDMQADPRERFNFSASPQSPKNSASWPNSLDAFFSRHADPQYDVWKDGRSKAGRLAAASRKPQAKPGP